MESVSLFEKINSKYIINDILNYVKDSNQLLKLAKYCKRLQNSFKFRIEDYKKKSFEIINYSKFENFLYVQRSSKFKKNYLKNKFEEESKQYDKIIRKTIANEFSIIYFTNKYEYYQSKEQLKKKILDNQFIIDIQSPFYKSLSKHHIFQNMFIIRIPLPLIKENDLMNEYMIEFEKLNESNTNYSALCFQFDIETKKYSDNKTFNFNIDFKKVKKLIFEEKNTKYYEPLKYLDIKKSEFLFFKAIFTDNDAVNNLIFLEIKNLRNQENFVYDLENINNFKSLEELKLENVIFLKALKLKLNTLKHLALCNCDQIGISENCALNLKSLSLFRSKLIHCNSSHLKFPELEQLKISFCYYQKSNNLENPGIWYEDFKKIIDLKSLKKLKFLYRGDISLFLELNNNSLEKAYISSYTMGGTNIEKSMIKKFIDIKTLKEIKLSLYRLEKGEINFIEGENTSVNKLIIDFHNYYGSYNNDLYNLMKKFPNLTEIEIYDKYSRIAKLNLESTKIERLKYSKSSFDSYDEREFSIISFEHLKYLELRNITKVNIPIFNVHYDNSFKCLIKFELDNSHFYKEQIDLKVINNIIKNVNEIPSLKCFIFKCYSDINEKEYNELIKKVLKLKIKSIEFGINGFAKYKEYTEQELKSIYKDRDFKYIEKIKIYMFNSSWKTSIYF